MVAAGQQRLVVAVGRGVFEAGEARVGAAPLVLQLREPFAELSLGGFRLVSGGAQLAAALQRGAGDADGVGNAVGGGT
ncbi:MAG: hypothetical protein GEV09_20860 [Pseudonocardiaceae bacterium]|nr:hypothetical protein [Pseudonocardiaceae bacterium]